MKPKLLACLLLVTTALSAQQKKVTGRVTEAGSNTPVVGATISVPGTNSGTTTDSQGNFSLNVPDGAKTLNISFINYITQEVSLNGEPVTVSLRRDTKGLDEVVVVGYGSQKKRDLTGAVSTISGRDVAGRQTVQVSEALQGAVAGVSVTRSNSAPGAGATIRVRGVTTIGTNDALYVVDGTPVSSIDNVNSNDIESLTVLKDAASAAIYGSRGAAGVILITTKRARDGQAGLEYTYEYGAQKATALPKYVGVQDYMRYFNEQSVNDGASAGPFEEDYIAHYLDSNRVNPDAFPNTDWQQTVMTKDLAPRQRHDLVFTIGNGKVRTKASLGYSTTGAFYDNRNYDRYLFRINNDMQVTSTINVNLDVFYKRTVNKGLADELTGSYNPIYEARIMPGIYDDFYEDGRLALGKDGRNPIAKILEGGYSKLTGNQMGGRLAFNFKPVKGLTLTALAAPVFDLDKSKNFSAQVQFGMPDGSTSSVVSQAQTTLTEGRTEQFAINGQFLATYGRTFGNHSVNALAGYEENYTSIEVLEASRSGFTLTDFPYLDAGSTELRTNSGSASEYGLHSVFGRLQYNFKEKYFIQGNIRSDQSSRFASGYRTAIFPSVSAGWALSEEKFLHGIGWLSFLKLRASWGRAGNERLLDKDGNPTYYPYQSLLTFTNALFYQNGVVVPQSGASQEVYAVADITWETSETADIGLDATLLNNRLTFGFDYYKRKTFDILLPLDIPEYLGFDKPNQNAGILNVRGWELEAGWHDNIGKLGYTVTANLSDNRSTVGDLRGTEYLGDQVVFAGSQYDEWYGYLSEGLFQTEDEVTGSPVISADTKAGDVRYVDVNKDGRITPDDKVLLGGSLPRYIYGGNIRLEFKGFDFGLVVQGVGKQKSRLPSGVVQPFSEAFGNVPQNMAGKFWSTTNTAEQNLAATYPRLSRTSNSNNYALSNFWLINGAYCRLKNLTVGYTFRQALLKKAGLQSVRWYVSANDLLSFSKFPSYLDPESADYDYPIVTTFMTGLTVKF